jgi:hypothetical protein
MPTVVFETTKSAGERAQTYVDRAATGIVKTLILFLANKAND